MVDQYRGANSWLVIYSILSWLITAMTHVLAYICFVVCMDARWRHGWLCWYSFGKARLYGKPYLWTSLLIANILCYFLWYATFADATLTPLMTIIYTIFTLCCNSIGWCASITGRVLTCCMGVTSA